MLGDDEGYALSQNIIDPTHFDDKLRPVVEFIKSHRQKYGTAPPEDLIHASTGVHVVRLDSDPGLHEWYLSTIEGFARYKALENIVLKGVDLLQKGRFGELERQVKEAVSIGLTRDLGTSYFSDPISRLERIRDNSANISTGWETLDKKLYGGFTRGGLNIFAGGSGSGKSLALQNLALNWSLMGMNVIYFSLELSEELVSFRMDAMVSGVGTQDIFSKLDEVVYTIRNTGRKAGELCIKKLPETGTTVADLSAFMKEWETRTGKKVDAFIVDYLDLMYPTDRTIDVSVPFIKDKYTSEEMRALAGAWNVLCATASQLNRQSVDTNEFDHSHIAGGISKINTADNVFAILATPSMRANGRYQIQFLKTRSSAATGQKLDLAYNPITMRITDQDPVTTAKQEAGRDVGGLAMKISSKVTSTVSDDASIDPIKALMMKVRSK